MSEPPDVIPIRRQLPSRAEFELLVTQANKGDAAAIEDLRRTLDEFPQIWRKVGDLSAVAGNSLIKTVANGNRLVSSSIARHVDELRKELLGTASTRLDRLAIERLLLAWLQAYHTDAVVASLKDVSQGTLSMWLKRQRQAARQFDAAVKSLAMLRKLLPAAAERTPGKKRRA